MLHLRHLRTHTKLLIGLTLTLVVLVSWIGLPNYSLSNRATQSNLADTHRSTNPAGESASRPTPSEPEEATRRRVAERYGQLPLSFEANEGQTDPQVNFLSRGSGYNLFLTPTEAVMVMSRPSAQPEQARTSRSSRTAVADRNNSAASTQSVLRMKIVGANPEPQVAGLDGLPGTANYFIGNDPSEWRTNVPTYGRVHYRDVYAGIDLVYYGNQRQLEYDFVVAPGANPNTIRLRFEGAEGMRIDGDGELVLGTNGGEVRQHKPVIYQEVDGTRQEVAGRYVLTSNREVGFEVTEYDKSQPLVIDPVLSYSTYLGGFSSDYGFRIAVDSSGNAYVTGETRSVNFPTMNPFQATLGLNAVDAFVTKFNAAGSALIYSTFLGGSGSETGYGIAVDDSGSAYVTGETRSTNFPRVNPLQPAYGGGFNDAFVARFDAAGAVVYSTFLGGTGDEIGFNIVADVSGNAYVTGNSSSTNFPRVNPFQATLRGNNDVFVTKFNATGSAFVYSTFLGGSGDEIGSGITVDAAGNIYVIGQTSSFNFPTMNPFQATHGGFMDAFVTKFDATGTALIYSTFLGGNNSDFGYGIAVDNSGNAYVTGQTVSTDFPTVNAFQSSLRGFNDAFVTKFDASGMAPYSTYLGGNNFEAGSDIAVDTSGNAYVTGRTSSTSFPTMNPLQAAYGGGNNDAFVTKFNATGTALIYSTYLGGNSDDDGSGIAVDGSGNAYVTGSTGSANFPTMNPFQAARAGLSSDAFVTKISDDLQPPPEPIRVVLSRDGGGQLQATITITNPLAEPVPDVTMTLVRASTLDGSAFVDGVPVPQAFGTVNPGQSVAAVVTFPGTAEVPSGFAGLVRVDLSYTGGTYTETKQVVTP